MSKILPDKLRTYVSDMSSKLNFDNISLAYELALKLKEIETDNYLSFYYLTVINYTIGNFALANEYAEKTVEYYEKLIDKTRSDQRNFEFLIYMLVIGNYILNDNKWESLMNKYCVDDAKTKQKIEDKISALKKIEIPDENDKKKEVEFVIKHLKKKTEIDDSYYILPISWIKKWKNFINFSKYSNEQENIHQDFMEDQDLSITGPGPFINDSLFDFEDGLSFMDFNENNDYLNLNLKSDLRENIDFIMVNSELFNYFFKKYKGIKIKRIPYYPNEENKGLISIEIFLKKVRFVIYPLSSEDFKTHKHIYVSRESQISEIREKFIEIMSIYFVNTKSMYMNIRLWKIELTEHNIEQLKTDSSQIKLPLQINGELLSDNNVKIEDLNFGESDFILIEWKTNDKWFISVPEVIEHKKSIKMVTNSGFDIKDLVRHYEIDLTNKYVNGSKRGKVGLRNIGNTCFMNSGIQCLSHTYLLTQFFLENKFIKDINTKNPLGLKGLLAVKYGEIIKELWQGEKSEITPWDLKKVIARYSSQFVGYSQHDSQELISYLLDGIHEDLNRIIDKPIIKETDNDNKPDEIVALESWQNYLKRNDSIIVDLFHGQFKSKIICPTCSKVSITFDPFNMISLPIPCKEIIKFDVYFINYDFSIPKKITVAVNSNSSIYELKKYVAKLLNISEKNFHIYLLEKYLIKENIDDSKYIKFLIESPGLPFIYNLMENDKEKKLILCKTMISQEPKYFYESEKYVTYPRLFVFDPEITNFIDLHHIIYEHLREKIIKFYEKNGITPLMNMSTNPTKEILNLEYQTNILKCKEPLYKLVFINNGSKICILCGKNNCKGCKFPYENDNKILNILKLNEFKEDYIFQLEVKIFKQWKIDCFQFNLHQEITNENLKESSKKPINIYDCFTQFTQEEKLEKGNEWYCNKCKDHKLAIKKMDIYKAPTILIVHLKRFKSNSKQSNYSSFFGFGNEVKKINQEIDFNIDNLDINNFIINKNENYCYELFAISNHFGSLNNGHYTAFAKNKFDEKWYDFDDNDVREISENKIVTSAAYILFYKRK